MSLNWRIALRLVAVAVLCLAAAVIWILGDITSGFRREAAVTAERVGLRWEGRPGIGSIGVNSTSFLFGPEARSTVAAIVPGVCVDLSSPYDGTQRICNAWDGLSDSAPDWFAALYHRFYAEAPPTVRPVVFRGRLLGSVTASSDPKTNTERAWQQVRVLLGIAGAMVLAMTALSGLVVGHALLPVKTIIRAIRELEREDLATRLPHLDSLELDRIATAFNDLAARLQRTTIERQDLMQRLFAVQEEERRALAMELHDDFGQCLTAAGALAAAIEAGTPPDTPDIADDARAIARMIAQMKMTLRSALAHLRVPELEEIGLAACLASLVGSWNAHRRNRTRFLLEMQTELPELPTCDALGIFRVIQESLTNAARHGSPSEVKVVIARELDNLVLCVEDDGGGNPEAVAASAGFGIIGMHERIATLGGVLDIARARAGIAVRAIIPAFQPGRPAT